MLELAGDERLTQEMRRGNEAAFEVVYGRYAGGLLALCRQILGSADEAEEALQQSLAAAWADLQRHDRPAPELLKPWLYAVARHRCLSMLRRRHPSTAELEELPSTVGLADEVGRRAELRELLVDLRDLPEEQRTALVLAELGGLSHADIADVLGRRVAGIKSLVFEARATLGDWREARDVSCAEIREQLSSLHRGALRRRVLRRHLQACASCREFRAELREQRRRLAIVLPTLPSVGLKRGVLATLGLGATGGGGTAGGLALVGLGVPALVPIGSTAMATLAAVGVLAGGRLAGDDGEAAEPALPLRVTAEHERLQGYSSALQLRHNTTLARALRAGGRGSPVLSPNRSRSPPETAPERASPVPDQERAPLHQGPAPQAAPPRQDSIAEEAGQQPEPANAGPQEEPDCAEAESDVEKDAAEGERGGRSKIAKTEDERAGKGPDEQARAAKAKPKEREEAEAPAA